MKKLYAFFIILSIGITGAAKAQKILYVDPIIPDGNTVLLDHFDQNSIGEIVGTTNYLPSVKELSTAIWFPQNGNYLIYKISTSLESAGTLEMWINPMSFPIDLLSVNRYYSYSYPGKGEVFSLRLDSMGRIHLSDVEKNKSKDFSSVSSVNADNWTHLTVSWGDSTKIYLNGKLDMVTAEHFRPAFPPLQTYFYVASWGIDNSALTLDEFHVSKVQRTDAEIASRVHYIQTDRTINLIAGTLSDILTSPEKENITKLKLIGTIDARDFKTMRDSMPALTDIDIKNVSVLMYTGTDGTIRGIYNSYPADCIPPGSFVPHGYNVYTSIILPSSITCISKGAFLILYGALDLIIPNSVTSIGSNAFASCYGLRTITLPNSLTSISDSLFFMDWSLTGHLTIPNSVTSIGKHAFDWCTSLSGITIPNSVTSIGEWAFYKCRSFTEVVIPNSVTTIGNYAFHYCVYLKSITIPSSVTYIGTWAFSTTGISTIYSYSTIPIFLNQGVFDGINKTTCILYVPTGTKFLYQSADQWKDFVNIVEMAPTGTKVFANDQLIVYPTIVTDGFSIDNGERTTHVSICTLNGVQLLSGQVTGKSYIDMASYPAGMYIVKITSSEGVLERKIFKR